MNNLFKKISSIGIIPVITLDDISDAAPLAQALCKGGLPIAEVTYRTPCAHDAMIAMKKNCPEIIIGAGTILTKEQVDSALNAGAEFIVSPGLNPEIVKYCQSKKIPIIPGCSNASDIEIALSLGLDTEKNFPAEPLGGLSMIKALSAPYTQMNFIPTGGINANNINEYLRFDKIIACGGTWMIDKAALKNKDFSKIEVLTREAVNTMLNIQIKEVRINSSNQDDPFSQQLEKEVKGYHKDFFESHFIKVVNEESSLITQGSILMGVNSVQLAKYYFEAVGYTFDDSTIDIDQNGHIKSIYFKKNICGFSIQLIKN